MQRVLTAAALFIIVLPLPLSAAQETIVSAGAGGVFPDGTTFAGISVEGLDAGFGLEIESGEALGEFTAVLLGTSALGLEQNILITGKATAGAQTAVNAATFSGTCTVDLGDGTVPTTGVPFTASLTTNDEGQGTLGLVIGTTTLPDASINVGSMAITVAPTATTTSE